MGDVDEGINDRSQGLHRFGHGDRCSAARDTRWPGWTMIYSRAVRSASCPPELPGRRVDLRDVQRAHLEGFDAVVHLAALSNDPLGNFNPKLTFDINHQASVRLAELAKEAGVPRFLYSSSCSLYGVAGDEPVTEEAAFNPVTPYGESKVRVERDLVGLADDDFSPTYLAQRHGLRALPLPSGGPGGEQPRRLRLHDGRGPDPE